MTLRATVAYDAARGTWVVTLWNRLLDVPYYFGERSFPTWKPALAWAIRRVGLGG